MAAKKKSSLKSKKASLTASDRAALLALDPSFAANIDRPVADIVQEARELEAVLDKVAKKLVKHSRLDKAIASSLAARRAALDAAEALWTEHRVAALDKSQKATREKAEALKQDMIQALRHFLEEDEQVQKRVDDIIPGTDLADLVDDLKKLAALVDEHAAALKKADLPAQAAKSARDFAEALSVGAAERAASADGAEAKELRNRAYWWLRGAMDEIRSAGRYVFRDDPKMLKVFRASSTRARVRATSAKPAEPQAVPAENGAPA
jgi:chaperonin cofactor prefoldin